MADSDAPQVKLDTPTGFLGMWDVRRTLKKKRSGRASSLGSALA